MQRFIKHLTLIALVATTCAAAAVHAQDLNDLDTFQVPDLSPPSAPDPGQEGESLPAPGNPFADDEGIPAENAYPDSGMGLIDLLPVPYAHPGAHLWAGYCNGCDTLEPCPCPPAWASVDALWLQRSGPDNYMLANEDGAAVLQADQFKFDYELGVRVTYGEVFNCTPYEFTYMGTHDWNSSIGVDGDRLVVPAGPGGGVFDNMTGDTVFANYASELHSLELNTLSFRSDSLTMMFGIRYIDVEEDFHLLMLDGLETGVIGITGDNRLLGLQCGGEWTRGNCKWCVSASGKAGMYINFAERDYDIRDSVLPTNIIPNAAVRGETSDMEIAVATELRLGVTRHLGCGLKLRGGYELLWINGVALAPEQLGTTTPMTLPAFDTDGDVLYDGGYIGLEWSR